MGMSKCYKFMKCLLIVCNIVLLVVGLSVCGLAVWALCAGVAGVAGDTAPSATSGAAGLGALALWGGALGAGAGAGLGGAGGGALLGWGLALSALCGVAEGAAAWWAAAHAPQLERALRDNLRDLLLTQYGRAAYPTQIIDSIQQGLDCCGAESPRDWQRSAWSRAQAAAAEPPPAPAPASAAPAAPAAPAALAPAARAVDALDLTVGAPPEYYWVPPSCCVTRDAVECSLARRVPIAGGGVVGVAGVGCGARAVARLALLARGPLAGAAAAASVHALQLILALALALRAPDHHRYKA